MFIYNYIYIYIFICNYLYLFSYSLLHKGFLVGNINSVVQLVKY